MPITTNAVERANRRHRKMQTRTRIYRVRTLAHIAERIALDLLRDGRAQSRVQALQLLHHACAAPGRFLARYYDTVSVVGHFSVCE